MDKMEKMKIELILAQNMNFLMREELMRANTKIVRLREELKEIKEKIKEASSKEKEKATNSCYFPFPTATEIMISIDRVIKGD